MKNQQRLNFGVLYPREYGEQQSAGRLDECKTECLVMANSRLAAAASMSKVQAFLQLARRRRQEGIERELDLPAGRV